MLTAERDGALMRMDAPWKAVTEFIMASILKAIGWGEQAMLARPDLNLLQIRYGREKQPTRKQTT